MNPGLLPRVAEDRVHESRHAALAARSCRRSETGRGRALLRPVGHLLIRAGRLLAGPEPDHRPSLTVHRPRWSR